MTHEQDDDGVDPRGPEQIEAMQKQFGGKLPPMPPGLGGGGKMPGLPGLSGPKGPGLPGLGGGFPFGKKK